MITITTLIIVCPLVFLGGFVDAVAGGGGLISLPAYLIAGLPVHNAIATNKLSSGAGTLLTTIRYMKSGFVPWKPAIVCIVCAMIGSTSGARLALMIDDHIFKWIMLIIIPLTALYVMRGKGVTEAREPYSMKKTLVIAGIVALVIGAYDGFYGPGTGTFLILLLSAAAHMKVEESNGIAKVINLTTNLSSLAVFLMHGKVIILLGAIAAVFGIAGNYFGSTLFKEKGAKAVKPIMIIVLIIFFVKTLMDVI
ncbi:MAG: TSUP family transporter [Eubacterium sp.]|nr:TSUP family transporter [Candidatus Colimonas fimequi]